MYTLSCFPVFLLLLNLNSVISSRSAVSENSTIITSLGSTPVTTLRTIPGVENKTMTDIEIMDAFEKQVKGFMQGIVKMLLPYMLETSETTKISSACLRSSMRWIGGIGQIKEWAMDMIDATGKLPVSLLHGTTWFMGDYDQCLNVIAPKTERLPIDENNELFRGQQCVLIMELSPVLLRALNSINVKNKLAEYALSKNTIVRKLIDLEHIDMGRFFKLRFDVCIPSTCMREDLEKLVKHMVGEMFPISVKYCVKKETTKTKLTALQISCCSIFGVLLLWVTSGTTLDLIIKFRKTAQPKSSKSNKFTEMLLAGSIRINTRKLLKLEKDRSFDSTYGIRFFTIIWVILLHIYSLLPLTFPALISNIALFRKFQNQYLFSFISRGFLSVDTFFFLSGFYQIAIKLREPKPKIVYWRSMIIRYVKFTIPQLIVLSIAFVLPLIDKGPFWKDMVEEQASSCKKEWWKIITYSYNFFSTAESCQVHLWFLSCLMQYFVFTLILLFIFGRWPKTGVGISALLIPAGITSNVIYFIGSDFDVMDPLNNIKALILFIENYYFLPNSHMSQYGVGLLVGYYFAKNPKLALTKIQIKIGWIVAIIFMIITIFGGHIFPKTPYVRIIYASLWQTVWTISVAWLTVMCLTRHGGFINRFLSLRIFVPLGRLSMFAYLLHVISIDYYEGIQRRSIYSDHLYLLQALLFICVLTFAGAYICYVCIQLPLEFIISLFLPGKIHQPTRKNEDAEMKIKMESDITTISISFKEA